MDEVDLLPAQGTQLRRSQAVPEGQQDHGRIPMSVPVPARRLHQPFDLFLGQVLPGSVVLVREATRANCSLYSGWRPNARWCFHWRNSAKLAITGSIRGFLRTVQALPQGYRAERWSPTTACPALGGRLLRDVLLMLREL